MTKNTIPPEAGAGQPEETFDRQAYLKEVREDLLTKLGLPKDTRPEQVARLLEIKRNMDKIKKDKDGLI